MLGNYFHGRLDSMVEFVYSKLIYYFNVILTFRNKKITLTGRKKNGFTL